MTSDHAVAIFCYVVGAAAPFALLFMALRYSEASRWIRLLFSVWGLAGIAWATLGLIRMFYWPQLTRQQLFVLDHWKTHIGGVIIGILISVSLSPDFWVLSRYYRRYSSLRSALEGLTKR